MDVHTHARNDYQTIQKYLDLRKILLSQNRMLSAYNRCFRILESDEMVEGSFFGMEAIKGLNLPREVLELIYYKNALRLYPRVSESKHL